MAYFVDKVVICDAYREPDKHYQLLSGGRSQLVHKRRPLMTDFETLRDWTCFDADTAKDLAVKVREYFIPDFSNWKDHDAFESAFARLKKDLEAENSKKS